MQVVRQTEVALIRSINELCRGEPSKETENFLRSLNKEIPGDVTRLFGTNFDAECVNDDLLEKEDGEMYVFNAIDQGMLIVQLMHDLSSFHIIPL